jgi:hypothetical protein
LNSIITIQAPKPEQIPTDNKSPSNETQNNNNLSSSNNNVDEAMPDNPTSSP